MDLNDEEIRKIMDERGYMQNAYNAMNGMNGMGSAGMNIGGAAMGSGMMPPSLGGPYSGGIGHPPIHRDAMLRDLIHRAARMAGRSMPGTVPTADLIAEHSILVKQLLEDFLEGAGYLQAQLPMVAAAFKDRPQLAERMHQSLTAAYNELVAQTFGDTK